MARQFALTPGASAVTYPDAAPALRRCASTRPGTAPTCASTRARHSLTSPMLAHAAVTSLFSPAKQAARHGRPGLQARALPPAESR